MHAESINNAVKDGNLEKVKALLTENAKSVDLRDENNRTPLHAATQNGHLDIAGLLISHSANVNAKNHFKQTPLFGAVFSGHNEIIELLLTKGADFNCKDSHGGSALHWAAVLGKKEVVRLFVKKGGKLTLHEAASCGFRGIIESYLKKGADVNRLDDEGMAPMHRAVLRSTEETTNLLLANGADINIKTKSDKTPLDLAIDRDKDEMVRLLVSKGGKETPVKNPEIAFPAKNIYRMTFPYELRANITVFTGPDGIVLVDTGLSKRYIKKINAALGKIGKGDIKYIINTHLHSDHVAGNDIAGDHTKIIDFKDLEKMKDDGFLSKAKGSLTGKKGKTFETYYTMNINGEEIRLIPFPGIHSDADIIVHFTRSGSVCMGDLLLNGSFPVVGGNVFEYLELLEKVMDVFPGDTTFICGHGPEFTKTDLKHFKKILLETAAIVKKRMRAEKSIDDMQKEDILKKYESWGTFIHKTEHWISTLYWSIKKSKMLKK